MARARRRYPEHSLTSVLAPKHNAAIQLGDVYNAIDEHSRADSDEETADEHDDPECTCTACSRVRGRRESVARARDAAVYGGLDPRAHALLGAGWIDGEQGGRMSVTTGKSLAQRALGDVFEQLSRIAEVGRERTRASLYTNLATLAPQAEPLTRAEVVDLLTLAENALDYARLHLGTLEPGEPAARRFHVGQRVIVAEPDDDCRWTGEVVGLAGERELAVRADDGTEHVVDERDAAEAA